jgi:hypothetical protein
VACSRGVAERGADAIGVGAVKMDQLEAVVLLGLEGVEMGVEELV